MRRTTGRSPLAIVHARIRAEADTLLDNSSLQIAEIAEALGFGDPAYFSRFFRRRCGEAPSTWRRRQIEAQ